MTHTDKAPNLKVFTEEELKAVAMDAMEVAQEATDAVANKAASKAKREVEAQEKEETDNLRSYDPRLFDMLTVINHVRVNLGKEAKTADS